MGLVPKHLVSKVHPWNIASCLDEHVVYYFWNDDFQCCFFNEPYALRRILFESYMFSLWLLQQKEAKLEDISNRKKICDHLKHFVRLLHVWIWNASPLFKRPLCCLCARRIWQVPCYILVQAKSTLKWHSKQNICGCDQIRAYRVISHNWAHYISEQLHVFKRSVETLAVRQSVHAMQ